MSCRCPVDVLARSDVEGTCGVGFLKLAADPTSSGQLGKKYNLPGNEVREAYACREK